MPEDLPALEQALQKIASRKCLSTDEQEDFLSWARLKLLTDGKGVIEKFRGRGKLSTYLTTVALNLLRDYRIGKWGKYRASAVARRLGTVAVRLEILIVRDGFGTSEAIEMLRRNEAVRASREQLEDIASQLPTRARPRFESDHDISRVPGAERSDDIVLREQAISAAEKIEWALTEALRTLSAEDRIILKLRVQEGLSIADIARTLHLDQKPLYRRAERLLSHLRAEMEAREVHVDTIDTVIGRRDVELRVDFGAGREIAAVRPSLRKKGDA